MALADDPWDATELVAYIPEVWSPIVNEEFFASAVATNFFTDLSSFVVGGGDTVHVPNAFTNAFTVQSQATQATVVTTDAPATVDDTLAINTHSYIAHLLGDKDAVQILRGTYNTSAIYARKAGGTILENLEAAIFALQSSVTTNTVNDTASVINDVDLRSAMSTQETNDVPRSEMAFFFHPYVTMRLLREIVAEQFRKLRGHLTEAIRSQAQKWEGSETIIGIPSMVMG